MRVLGATYIEDYKIKVSAYDGKKAYHKTCNFENFVFNCKSYGVARLKNKKVFKNFNIEDGYISWLNGDVDFDIDEFFPKQSRTTKKDIVLTVHYS